MLYKYFIKGDITKEALALIESPSLNDAYLAASEVKQLPLKEFKKLYEIESYEYRKKGDNPQS